MTSHRPSGSPPSRSPRSRPAGRSGMPSTTVRARRRCGTTAWPGCRRAARLMLPALDTMTRFWLKRSASPYVAEIAAIAAALDHSGIWFLNGCYQWGCTALVRDEDGAPWLARTLDWPFPGLGRHVEIARMRGPAGAFDTVTWPGFVGVLDGLRARPLRGLHQSGAAAAANPASVAAALRHRAAMRWRPGACASSRPTICCARCSRPAAASRRRASASRPRRSPGR